MTSPQRPLVVVGAGVAGLSTALACAPRPVLLVSRQGDAGAGTASALAQGGIAAALDATDTADAHARDTIAAGAGHNDATRVRQLVARAPAAIAWLQAQGVTFDRDGERLALGREGGHGTARIVHAGGDRTGAVLMAALSARARDATHIQWRVDGDADALLLRDGQVAGIGLRDRTGGREEIEADAVVFATGGLGALFARTTNPAGSAGAGLALALAAGARTRDLEFVQFHPTALAAGGDTLPLVTEALRGAGARLRDHRGRAVMAGVHVAADLAPRDVVARRVWQALREGPVWLDATALPQRWADAFPGVIALCAAHGVDPRLAPVPVTPAAHFHMGGIATDGDGRTSLPGLFAVGEVACNGVHGANRLASNSLLEGVVHGLRLGRLLARHGQATPAWRPRAVPAATGFEWRERGDGLDPAALERLRDAMWWAAGPQRSAAALATAIAQRRSDAPGWQSALAVALLEAALRRPQSLGAHWRDDTSVSMDAARVRLQG